MNIDSEGEEQVCGRLLISCPAHLPQRGRDLFSCPHSCVPWTKNSDGCSRLLREHLGNASVPSKGRLPKYMSKKRWEGTGCECGSAPFSLLYSWLPSLTLMPISLAARYDHVKVLSREEWPDLLVPHLSTSPNFTGGLVCWLMKSEGNKLEKN